MFTEKVEAKNFFKMPKEYQELVVRLVTLHAESELSGSDMYTQNLFPLAPNAKERYVCCTIAAQEVDHYMKTAQVLDEIGIDCSYMLNQKLRERQYYPIEAVRYDFKTWEDRAAMAALAELTAYMHIQDMANGSYLPFARILPDILKEEEGHVGHGWRILREMCKKTEEGKKKAQEAVNRWYSMALDCFGRSDSKRSELYVKWGLKSKLNDEYRQKFIPIVSTKIKELELTVPDSPRN